jgi:inhibitor of KinA
MPKVVTRLWSSNGYEGYIRASGGAVVKILCAGDTAITIEFGDHATHELSAQVLALDRRLQFSRPIPGIIETVPTMRSLTVYYNPLQTSQAALVEAVTPLLDAKAGAETIGRRWTLPMCCDADLAPDLADVAAATGMARQEVTRLHASTTYRVYMLGFLPGQAYLGDLPAALHLPRRLTPRISVPPGSVAIATSMATVYPLASPGGWHIIGHCPVRLFDAAAADPVLLAPADEVVFRIVERAEWQALNSLSHAA